jgi:hypothetical protein
MTLSTNRTCQMNIKQFQTCNEPVESPIKAAVTPSNDNIALRRWDIFKTATGMLRYVAANVVWELVINC